MRYNGSIAMVGPFACILTHLEHMEGKALKGNIRASIAKYVYFAQCHPLKRLKANCHIEDSVPHQLGYSILASTPCNIKRSAVDKTLPIMCL